MAFFAENRASMQTPSEGTVLDFHCSLTGKSVKIRLEHQLNVSRAGKRMGRQLSKIDCSNKDLCPIASSHEGSTTYDWAQCVYAHPPQSNA
jgi:hypothetical protein